MQDAMFTFMITMVNSISNLYMMDSVLSIIPATLQLISPIIPLMTVAMLLRGTEVHHFLSAGRSNLFRQNSSRAYHMDFTG